MAEIQLKNVRYRGDHPVDYENQAFKAGDDDVEAGAQYEHVTSPPHATELPTYDEVDKTGVGRSSSYTLSNNNVDDMPQATGSGAGEEEEEEDDEDGCCTSRIRHAQSGAANNWRNHRYIYCWTLKAVLMALYFAYLGYALHYEFGSEPSVRLLWVTCLVVFFILLNVFWHFCGKRIKECCAPCTKKLAKRGTLISWIIVTTLFLAMIVFVFVDVFVTTNKPYNLVSGAGILIYIGILFITSVSPSKVQWRAVVWGLALQFLFAIIILRWQAGFQAFKWLGARITEFLDYSDVGAQFLFGDDFRDHFFAFKILPTIIFFSTIISILYYLGAMQVIVRYVALVMQFAMGTTAGESLNAAGNIFVGQTEAPLMIRPMLPNMTKSELHAVMTGGFATIAGGVLAAYIGFNVPANHLLSASVMSAPAALAMAKLFYPEVEESKTRAEHMKKIPKSPEVNLIAAASNGASQSIKLVANVAVNLVAFLSLLAFINGALTWFGNRVGLFNPPLTFELICSYVFYPFAFIMGVNQQDCLQVAELIGVKTFLNEFIAYDRLGKLVVNRESLENHTAANGTYYYQNNDIVLYPLPGYNETVTLAKGILTVRSEAIATYALCGFANIGSIGIQLGGLGAMAPERRSDLAQVAVRAMIAGNVACFMTACIAGLFFQG